MPKKPRKRRRDRTANLHFEREFFQAHRGHIFGIDEVGRGPWAGPIVVGAVCLPLQDNQLSKKLKGVRDSKDMTALQRKSLVTTIKDIALAWGIGQASAEEISEMGIMEANKLATERALNEAHMRFPGVSVDWLFLDYLAWANEHHTRQLTIIGGDKKSLSIASASIIAKVERDDYMTSIGEEFPQYGFEHHKGYGTQAHRRALEIYGITPLHRTNYAPVQAVLNKRT